MAEGFKTIFRNRPAFLLMLSDFLGAFTLATSQDNYFIDVLGYSTFFTLVEIPAIIPCQISYTYINAMKRRFSSRFLCVDHQLRQLSKGSTFAFGCIGGTEERLVPRRQQNAHGDDSHGDGRKSIWGVRQVVRRTSPTKSSTIVSGKTATAPKGLLS